MLSKNILKRLLTVSRPRFWLYELGTFYIGVLLAVQNPEAFLLPAVVIFGLYFLFPANLLIYGINDVFDYETDMKNPKKTGYESVLPLALHPVILRWAAITTAPFLLYVLTLSFATAVAFFLFLTFAIFYSAPPIRAKARPILDSFFSAGHYITTGVFGYFLAGGAGNIWWAVVAGMLWAMAMHAYSAVPDIQADTEAGLATVATLLTKKPTIWLCLLFYTAAAYIATLHLGAMIIVGYIPYLLIMILSLYSTEKRLFFLYTFFPYINALVGMGIFFSVLFLKGWL